MAIADVYDAMINARVYKAPIPHDQVMKTIIENKGTHFDPDVVDAFVRLESEVIRISEHFADH